MLAMEFVALGISSCGSGEDKYAIGDALGLGTEFMNDEDRMN